ncbi:hypothetical protein FACS1894217_04000 [Clostridia bacterium]|nr:hypothetical protein FACS1894217_04000 [Clostridia bacterium]
MTKETTIYSSKWVKQIVDLQLEDGSWGHFHTLSQPTKERPMTTEQALRRLRILGLTKDDEPIVRALAYMEHNLNQPHPTVFHEKKHDSKTYGDLMLATWIRLFDRDNNAALVVANKWASIITRAFQSGAYSGASYVAAYESEFVKLNPKAGCMADFVVFYQLALLPGLLSSEVESLMLDYVLAHQRGIYYIYESALDTLPEQFSSRKASRYLSAIELLSEYSLAPEKLGFVAAWLKNQQDQNGQWDMGSAVKDGIYFPLSDSWRKVDDRKRDCTIRVMKLLQKL